MAKKEGSVCVQMGLAKEEGKARKTGKSVELCNNLSHTEGDWLYNQVPFKVKSSPYTNAFIAP